MSVTTYGMTIRSGDDVILVIPFSHMLHYACIIGVIFAVFFPNPKKPLAPHRKYVVLIMGAISLFFNRHIYLEMMGFDMSEPEVDSLSTDATSTIAYAYEWMRRNDKIPVKVEDLNTNDKNGRVHQERSPEGIYKDENQLDLLKDTNLMLTDEKEWQEIQMTEDSLSKDSKTSVHNNKNNGKNAEL